MVLKDFVAVSGLPGVYKLMATRSNGLLLQEIDSEKTKFASSRKHQFTPLESVAIYTENDSTELSVIFDRISDTENDTPLPEANSTKDAFFDYFSEIVPDYDEDRVMVSDVKKVVKWYKFLKERNLLVADEQPSDAESSGEDKEDKE